MQTNTAQNISREILSAYDPWYWAFANKLGLVGGTFALVGHEYQIDVMQCDARRQCERKAAQMTFTETNVLKTLHGLIHRKYPQGVLYLFPTGDDVTDFSASRFSPLIQDNPKLIKQFIRDTNRANLKRIGNAYLFFRGARLSSNIGGAKKSSTKLKSIPVDKIVFDEVDEMTPAAIDLALERMSHSKIKEEVYLSTPTLPDQGIDLLYQQSDQRVWIIRCDRCGSWTCLETEFPECVVEDKKGRFYRACKKCRREIYPHDGRWVARYPNRSEDMVGWYISQLNSIYVDPGEILRLYHDPPNGNLGEVYNSKLGRAYIEAENRLSIQQVLALCTKEGISSSDPGPCYMGVDQGKDLHVVIGKANPMSIVHLAVYKDWEELDNLMRNFHVVRCVVDGLPETRNARAFAKRFDRRVFLSYYQEHQKGYYLWDEAKLTVASNRTESLDSSHKLIIDQAIKLPKQCDITKEFADHLHNVGKKLEEDELTGAKRYIYIKLGSRPDHFRHAFNYEIMAAQNAPKLLYPGL